MQNEDTPSEVNPFFAIAERMSKPPAAPTMPTDNPFMDLAPSVSTVSQPPAIGSLSAVAGINPDQAAEATKLGTPLGIGQDLALRNMDELRRRSMVASVQRSGMLQNNPRLAQSLLDPVFAAQAHDDLDSLNATSNLFYKVASGIFETRAALLGGWERGFGTVERGELQSRKIFGSATPLDVARLEYLEKRLGDMPPGGVVSMTAEVVAQQLATARSVGTTALIGAAGGAAFGGVPGSVAGFLSFGAAGLMATTTQTEAGNLYGDMVADGVDPDTARYAALTGGLLNGIIELAGAKIAAAPFKALASKLMKDAVSSAIAKPTTRAAMAIAGKEYAKQVGTETAEEIGQELVAITSEELAKAFDGVDSEMSLKKAMTRLVDAGIAGFQGSLVLGGIGPTANFVVDVKRADVAAKQQEFFDGLDAAKRDGKLPKRNLDAYEGFLARQAKGTTADTVYVEAEAAAQVLAQSGLSVTELEKVLPGIREQLQNALENGGDITIPTAVYGAKLSGTQLGDALRPHMRLSPEAMSVAQAQEFSRKRDALRQEAQAALAEQQEADAAVVESAQKVETTVAEQLRQTGMQDIEVRANAELFRGLAVTQAARMGITPEQFYERYPYRVRGPQAVREGRVPDSAAVDTPIGGEQINLIQTEMAPATVQVQQAIDAKAIDEKQGKQAKDSLRRISRAIENKNAGELAGAVYTAKKRNIPQLAQVVSVADQTLASLGVEAFDPVGREYLEGTAELEVVAFEPYQDGQTNEATHVVRTLRPIVRQNGQIIQRGQVVVREGSPQYLARQEQIQEAKRAEMRARLVGAQQPLEQANQFDQAGQRKTDTPEFRQWNERPTEQGGTNKLADAQGQPLRFYHGTSRGGFTQFDPAFLGTGAGYSRGGFSFVTSREQAEAYAERASEDRRIVESMLAELNPLFQEQGMYERFLAADIWAGAFDEESGEPAYWDSVNIDGGSEELYNTLDWWISRLRKVGDRDLVLRLGAIRDIGRPTAEPQVYEVYLYAGQQVREFEATPDTIGDVLAGIDVRSQPGGAVIVNMSNGDKVVIVSDPTNIKSTDNRGTFSRATPNIFEQAARIDANYLDAVERGDMETAQRMVDEASYAQGYQIEAFHGTDAEDFSAFKYGDTYNWGPALYFSPNREYASEYLDRTGEGEPRVMRVKLRIDNMFSPESNPEHLALYRRLTQEARDEGLTHQEFEISGPQGTKVKYGNTGLSNLVTYTDQWWLVEKLWREGFDGFRTTEADGETVGIAVRDPSQVKLADPVTRDEAGNVVPLSRRFDITSPKVFEQAARAPRGDFDPSKLMTTLREGRDFSTFLHETAHFYLTILADIARSATGPEQTKADMDALLRWFGIEGATPAERLAKWSSMTIDQQRQYHEQFAYSVEIYLHEGKAPSVEMQSLFNQFAAWLKRVYKSIRDELNATYKAQFGRDLPMMNSEIRLVMDRMLATDEQIARAQAVRGMKVMFETQEQSGMPDAEWAALKILEQEATDAATAELTKATLKELQWYSNAQSKYLREMQSKHDRARKEIREEVSAQVQLEPVYRAMDFLKRGTIRTDTGEVTAATGAFKLDLAKVRAIMPAGFDPASLKYGKYGMVQEGGIDPDMAAGMFGYGSGVELINALLAAKPIKDEINARTDQRMLDENSDLATPEARQAAVDMAIHNDFRARIIAVEQRWLEKSTRPVNDMMQAARQVAQDIIGDVVIRTLNPRRYEAAEAEAARTATTAYREPQDRVTAGRAAETKAYNEAIAAGQTPFEATVTSTQAGVEASVKATERLEEFRAKYGGREPAEVARRAKRQQLVQNQLAREAMLAKEEIAAAGRDFRKFFRSDEKLAKTRDMAPIMAARAILSYYGYGKRGESPAQYLEQLRTYAPELYDQIAPIVLKSLSGTADYRDLTVTEFRVLRDTVQALWAQARRDRQITVEGERVALDVVLKELTDRLETIGVGERVGQRQAPGPIDRANRTLLTAAALATRVETWADTLDGIGGPGPFTKYLVRPVLQAVDRFKVARNNYVKRFVDLLNTLELPVGKIAAPELNYTFGNGNGGIGKAELLGALMHTGNESNYRKLLLGRGWGELDADGNLDDSKWRSFVNRMIAEGKLTKADYDFVQSIWDLLEEIKPIAQRAHFEMYGYYFKEIEATEVVTPFGTYRGGYVPAATDKFMVQDARVKDGIDELEADWRNSLPSTGAGFTKSRVAGYNEALSLDLSVIASHTDSVLRFSIIQPAVKDANKLLTNREFKALLARFNPVAYESMLKPWLIRTARQQAAMPGMFKALDRGLNGLRKRAALSIFVGNFRNAISNATGWFPASLKVQPRNLKSAFLVYMGDRGGTTKTITELSPFMAEVLQSQMFELQTTMNDILLNPSKYQKLQQWSDQHGLFAQRAVQNVVSIVTWLGKFNQTIVEMKKEGASEAEAQTEAIARADFAVRQTQGSQTPESISAFEFGTPFYRTFTQFGGWGNTMANLNAGEWVKTVRDLGWRSGKSRLIYIYLMGVMVPAMVEDAIKRTFNSDWDPEDDETYLDVFLDWFFGSQARYVAGLIPFGGAITTALTAGFTDNTWDDRMLTSPSISVLEASTVGTSKAVVAIFDEDKDITGRNVRDVLTMLTTFTGIPVSALGRPAGYLIDVERGEIEPESGYDMIRGMITGTATPESKR